MVNDKIKVKVGEGIEHRREGEDDNIYALHNVDDVDFQRKRT